MNTNSWRKEKETDVFIEVMTCEWWQTEHSFVCQAERTLFWAQATPAYPATAQTPALGIFRLCQPFLANYSDVPPFLQYANWINTMKNDRMITSPPVHCSVGRTQRKFFFPQVLWELNCNSRGSAGGTDCFMFYSSNASAFSFCLHPGRGWSTLSSLSKVAVQSVSSVLAQISSTSVQVLNCISIPSSI